MNMFFSFIVGVFMSNGMPHFINGVQGKSFHTPFSTPPVRGSSSALVNVLWGLSNFTVAVIVHRLLIDDLNLYLCSIGFVATSVSLAQLFSSVDENKDK